MNPIFWSDLKLNKRPDLTCFTGANPTVEKPFCNSIYGNDPPGCRQRSFRLFRTPLSKPFTGVAPNIARGSSGTTTKTSRNILLGNAVVSMEGYMGPSLQPFYVMQSKCSPGGRRDFANDSESRRYFQLVCNFYWRCWQMVTESGVDVQKHL